MRIAIILLLFAPLCLIAQSNYKEGYLITQTGDTLKGFIDYKEWYRNPEKIRFKHSQDNTAAQDYGPEDIRCFNVAGFGAYGAFTLPVSMNKVGLSDLTEAADTTSVVKTIFLKEVLRGDRVNLYSYTDKVKSRFFVLNTNQSLPGELLFRKTLKGMEENTEALFRQQLTKLAVEHGVFSAQTERLINSAAYAAKDIEKVINKINSVNETHDKNVPGKAAKSSFFMGIGITKNKITYTGENLVTVDGLQDQERNKYKRQVTQAYLPRVAAGMDFYPNAAVRKTVLRMEVSASQIKSTVKSYYKYSDFTRYETENTYKLSAWNFAVTPQFIYNLYNTPKFRFYVGAGASFSYYHHGKNSLYRRELNPPAGETENEEYFLLKKYSLSAVVRSGVRLNQCVDLSILWGNKEEYTGYKASNSSIKAGLLAFSAGYSFGK